MGIRLLFIVPPDEAYRQSYFPPYVPLGLGIIKAYLAQNGISDVHLRDMRELRPSLQAYISFANMFPFRVKMLLVDAASSFYHHVIAPLRERRASKRSGKKISANVSRASAYHSAPKTDARHMIRLRSIIGFLSPNIIGFACLTYDQLFSALDLCKDIKRRHPGIKTLLGGPYISKHLDDLCQDKHIRGVVDYYISGDAEEPVHLLVKALERGQSLADVPNLTYYSKGRYKKGESRFVAGKAQLALCPDFSGLRVYDSLIIRLSLGCYWGRCAYCTYRREDHKTYFMEVACAVDLLRTLQRRYKIKEFHFKDDALPPAFVRRLCQAIIDTRLDIRWTAFVCCDEGFDISTTRLMRKAGCRGVLIGLDSFSARMLKIMGKMQTPESSLRVLESFASAGVRVTMCLIFGFPGEKPADAQMTVDFIEKHGTRFGHISPEIFVLEEGSEVFAHPGRFGIKNIRKRPFSPRMRRPECFLFDDPQGLSEEEKNHFYRKAELAYAKSRSKK